MKQYFINVLLLLLPLSISAQENISQEDPYKTMQEEIQKAIKQEQAYVKAVSTGEYRHNYKKNEIITSFWLNILMGDCALPKFFRNGFGIYGKIRLYHSVNDKIEFVEIPEGKLHDIIQIKLYKDNKPVKISVFISRLHGYMRDGRTPEECYLFKIPTKNLSLGKYQLRYTINYPGKKMTYFQKQEISIKIIEAKVKKQKEQLLCNNAENKVFCNEKDSEKYIFSLLNGKKIKTVELKLVLMNYPLMQIWARKKNINIIEYFAYKLMLSRYSKMDPYLLASDVKRLCSWDKLIKLESEIEIRSTELKKKYFPNTPYKYSLEIYNYSNMKKHYGL